METAATAGELLRRARSEKSLSCEDLARFLRLDVKIIEHIEANRYELLPSAAFVKGYLRTLAAELDLDPDRLAGAYANEDPQPPLSDFQSRAPRQITANNPLIQLTSAALLVALVILIVMWWQGRETETVIISKENISKDTAATEPLPYQFTQVLHPDVPRYSEALDPAAGSPAPAAPADLPDDAEQSTAVSGADSRLSLKSAGEAWIEIVDADRKQLFYDLMRNGDSVSVSGTPPFSLLIGNASAVELMYQGESVSIMEYARDGVARFELGANR
ncbi:MAG: RodZ domain-containing protein [Pseudomonadota bacterium]